MPAINSEPYWDYRFTHDWEANNGREQTRFFARLALDNLPDWFAAEVKSQGLTVCDWGCAEGDGTDLLARTFGAPVVGIDFSRQAISKAKRNFPALTFRQADLLAGDSVEAVDLIFSSNTLEHFPNPAEVLDRLLGFCRWGAVLLLPFREYLRLPEHSATFDFHSVHLAPGRNFVLVHSQVLDTSSMLPTYWGGEQVLLVYLHVAQAARLRLALNAIHLETQHLQAQVRLRDDKIAALREKCAALDARVRILQGRCTNLEARYAAGKAQLRAVQEGFAAEKEGRQQAEEHLGFALERVRLIESGWSWRLTGPLRAGKRAAAALQTTAAKAFFLSRREGLRHLARRCRTKYFTPQRRPDRRCRRTIDSLLAPAGAKPTIVFLPVIDWNVPLFQRPQHMAVNLARLGWNYLYCTPGIYDRDLRGTRKAADNLYITDQYAYIEELLLERPCRPVVVHCYAQDHRLTSDLIDRLQAAGHRILYEYIDAIDDKLSVAREKIIARHRRVLEDERCCVVATAGNLLDEVRQCRSANFLQVTNGVDFDHFAGGGRGEAPREIAAFIAGDRPVIGYFGALASWFDFDLVIRLAKARPDVRLLLLGWDYDGTLGRYKQLAALENVKVLGPIPYPELPRYARHFTVATIPFLLNDITRATNPIKLFEYMALGVPIVTTDLPECRKYQSPLIGRTPEEFIRQIDRAIDLRKETGYRAILRAEALANTWSAKAAEVAGLIAPEGRSHAIGC